MDNQMLIYMLVWLCVNAFLYALALYRDAGVLEYVAIFVFMGVTIPQNGWPGF